jgi:hypothetical protein
MHYLAILLALPPVLDVPVRTSVSAFKCSALTSAL